MLKKIHWLRGLFIGFLALIVASCSSGGAPSYISGGPLESRLAHYNLSMGDNVFIRIFKEEALLELWMKDPKSRKYTHFANYPICNYSGTLGPKFFEGDLQAPEGFYRVDLGALNPHSRFYRSFNLGFPNTFDRFYNRTGSHLMVHGKCDSVGCYAMTDEQMDEIYRLVEGALRNGQRYVEVHAFPFKMERKRLAREKHSRHYDFWKNLKEGYDYFEKHHSPGNFTVVNGRYHF